MNHLHRCRRLLLHGTIVTLFSLECRAQSISGTVADENNEPVPFAHIFITELQSGTSANEKGHYYLTITPGVFTCIVSSIGYQSKTYQIIVTDKSLLQNFTLPSSSTALDEVVVKAKRRDPAYEIIQRVIKNKAKYMRQVQRYQSDVYIKAGEVSDKRKIKKHEPGERDDNLTKGPPEDPFEKKRKEEEARLQNINLVEMQLTLYYQYPDRYKEERTAFKSYGTKEGLYLPVFSEADFNIYENLVDLKGISEIPFISPISRTAILSYKYKLEDTFKEEGQTIYKIKVTPRKTGDATCEGYLFINDSLWNINRLELSLHKGALKFYDDFTLKQTHQQVDSGVWIPMRQEFLYETKTNAKIFKGQTLILYSNYQPDVVFPNRFFGNEVSVITKEAFNRDSSYWNSARPEPLTDDQKKVIRYRDSVATAHQQKSYLDSVEAKYNKITIGEVLYHGVGFRKESSKRDLYISPLLGLLGFEVIAGFRFGPQVRWFRRFDNGRMISTFNQFSVGVKNGDWQGGSSFWTRYNPYRLGDASVRVGRGFYSINSFDAYLNQLKISNYILHEYVDLFHRIELVNGFYVSIDAGFSNRKSVSGYNATSVLNTVIDKVKPIEFENYQAVITNLQLSYTPKQKYMSEPNRKVVLGSQWPTFSVNYRKGWDKILTSDVDFDYLDFTIDHNLLLGTLGNSRYTLTAGRFVNTRDLRYVDFKRFRQSDPILYSDPMHSFQSLDTSLSTTGWFLEAHYIHHFNGAMINNIPLIKKTKIRTVAGAGAMWIKKNNYRYEEIFGGLERIFKLGARRRLRIGAYGVLSQSNQTPPQTAFKISFDIIDTWKRSWSY